MEIAGYAESLKTEMGARNKQLEARVQELSAYLKQSLLKQEKETSELKTKYRAATKEATIARQEKDAIQRICEGETKLVSSLRERITKVATIEKSATASADDQLNKVQRSLSKRLEEQSLAINELLLDKSRLTQYIKTDTAIQGTSPPGQQ
eukprot:GHVU01099879.1.p3 GENE.GHVU01099879.1~~GHVU01099879.1.p3  ORF type:complete len:151 (-),score=27.90 GHVU01099879.1:1074-1526(-)